MKRFTTALLTASMLALVHLPLASCSEEGPGERMGRQIDEAVENAREAGEDLVDETKEAMGDAAEAVEESAKSAKEKMQQGSEGS
ncbi:MAG: hypothetical protein ACQGVK_14390 [Myxococcota bacterium]